jgi:polyvinyl alcohol dehydrogenase (cytochrome)
VKLALTAGAAAVLALSGVVTIGARAANLGGGTCAGPAAGGEWRSYGGGLANQRNQTAPTTLNPSTVANVAKAWSFDVSDAAATGVLGGLGALQSTPTVADGCVFLSTSSGFVVALNADTGQRVWTSPKLQGTPGGSLVGGVITGAPTVASVNGQTLVFVGVSDLNHPHVAALSEADGSVVWFKEAVDPLTNKDAYREEIVAAPVYWNGLIFQGLMADENSAGARGGYAIMDAATGDLKYHGFTITDAEYAAGYRGASMWCTAAVDADTGYAYGCGGNPASKQLEGRYTDSLLKIDMDPTRSTFGQIVAAYKGTTDHYYPGLDRQPACDQVPTTAVWSPTCVQLDLDFGASPNLYTVNIGGQPVKLVGDLQKSGIYHAVYADNMQAAWTTVVGVPGPTLNASSPAVDGNNVYTVGAPEATLFALSNGGGRYRWATPLPTGAPLYFESVSTANGVVYAVDNAGTVYALDAATGVPAKVISLSAETGSPIATVSSHGIAIARNTVYAAASSFVVAYR